jgi:catechol 2,3-dioxygenase-like lactoylglutathione lyase family enzyme
MNIRRVVPDIHSDHIEESRDFYTGFLGFQIAMDMGWVITFASRSNPTAQITVMRGEQSGAVHPQVSIEVDDVDQAHALAIKRNLKIVYPLVDEPWGVRRFFVADPNGVVINVLSHIKSRTRSSKALQPTSRSRSKAKPRRRARAARR